MPGFAYGSWLPDIDDLNSTTLPIASGCLPTSRGWGPWPSLSAISNAVGGVVRGAFMARTSSGSAFAFCGTATKLYKLAGTTWTDVSRLAGGNYNLPVDNYWTFAQQDKWLFAAQAGDVLQVIDVDAGANFTSVAALGATLFPTEVLGTVPTARYVASVGGFLFLMDLTGPVGSIQPTSGRIQFAWSGYRNPFFWKYGERSSDTGTLSTGGFIMGMTGPETGLMVQNNAVSRFVRVDDRRVWDFATIESQQGTRSPYSLVEHQGVLYYYGVDGFIASSPTAFSAETGIEVVDEWFKGFANPSRLGTILGALDPTRPRLWWLFASTGNSSYTLDHVIGYDVSLKRFFHGPIACSTIFKAATSGTTLEDLGGARLGYAMDAGFLTITNITKANPAVVTYSDIHSIFVNGSRITITGVTGMTEVNGVTYTVAGLDTVAKTFQLSGINSTGYGTYTGGGIASTVAGNTVPYSLDSDVWQGGVPQIGGFDAAQKLGFFSGAPMEALLKTGRIELIPGYRCYVNGWRPQTDATTVRGRTAMAETPQQVPTFLASAATPLNPWGVIEENLSGRVMAFEATIPAGTAWTSILGGDFDADMVKPDGVA